MVGDGPETRRSPSQGGAGIGSGRSGLFLGAQDSIESLLNCADLVLQPSASESFGLVILEAMAMGVPVISTRCGGPEEVVSSRGQCGFLSEIGDVEDMAANCMRLLTTGSFMKNSPAARGSGRCEHFNIEQITSLYVAFYRRVHGDKDGQESNRLSAMNEPGELSFGERTRGWSRGPGRGCG